MLKNLLLLCIFVICSSRSIIASPQDSIVLARDTFAIKDRIDFFPKIAETLSVPTMSCSCGDFDFMYKVYRLENGKWNLFIDHSEPENSNKCTCVHLATQLKDGVKYSIDALNAAGTFYLEIIGGKPFPVSKNFVILTD